ncbi:MAG: cytochrome c [Chloroflexi bacterium]|nr:cytochrome c [Chloroflexota bacterium]
MRTAYRSYLFVTLLCALVACGGGQQPAAPPAPAGETVAIDADTSYSARGNAENGKALFAPCSACHHTTTEQLVGPGLAGLFSAVGPVLPAGVDYGGKLPNGKERTETNIAAWIREGGQGQIGLMTPNNLNDQQMADLMAYLRTLKP